jgi:hypothetical protein
MDDEKKWVAVVYNYGEKVGSHVFRGEESEANLKASEWVAKTYGKDYWDWSFHQVSEH